MYHPTLFLSDDATIYTYLNRYVVFVNPAMDVRDRDQV